MQLTFKASCIYICQIIPCLMLQIIVLDMLRGILAPRHRKICDPYLAISYVSWDNTAESNPTFKKTGILSLVLQSKLKV
jgi:hypothetical protein